jgi:Caspase domain
VNCAKCGTSPKPNLIFLGIGISTYQHSVLGSDFENLSYADDDVREMAAILKSQNDSQPPENRIFNTVKAEVLSDEGATKEAILEKLDWMNEEAKANSNNVHVLYLSGHGGMDNNENYYFYTHNHDPKIHPEINDVRWAVIMEALTKAPGKAVIFIDTCHAGAIKGDTKLDIVYHAYKPDFIGMTVFIASDASGYSKENKNLSHGAFTFAVLEGLKGAADLPQKKDGKINVEELGVYIKWRVDELEPTQHPDYMLPFGLGSTVLFSYPPPK